MLTKKYKMPSESKPLLTTQTEKPNHYRYLKEFRVDQCPLFLQHKCTQHRPYTCFHWHFMNQRRRRPVRKRDGSFNYSADNYCTKFDETTGLCPDGDECPYLHRTAGDTERRYHLRYYKTCMCVHDTDARGYCVKNGPHCAFAHGNHDLRPPVYDIKELQALETQDGDSGISLNGPNVLDKERTLMNEDPKWQDSAYVLANYKTEQCKRPPRLCRQGYACPQFHNTRDKRRNPKKIKYRSTPCPNVKHADEWGEPVNCENGDSCGYCHTRTEQQFHPEIYKSTKCNDVQQAGYCPRGAFCAFAHIDQEMSTAREEASTGTNFADILSNVLPPDSARKEEIMKSDSSNGSGETSESASVSSIGSNSSSKAPGAQLTQKTLSSLFTNNHHNNHTDIFTTVANNIGIQPQHLLSQQQLLSQDKSPARPPSSVFFNNTHTNGLLGSYFNSDTVESVVGNALDDESKAEHLNLAAIDRGIRDLDADSPVLSGSISAGLANSGVGSILSSSDPVNIPGGGIPERNNSGLNFSPGASSPINPMTFLTSSRFQQETLDALPSQWQSHLQSKIANFPASGLYDFGQNMSPHHAVSHSPLVSNYMDSSPGNISAENQRLQSELLKCRHRIMRLEAAVDQSQEAYNRLSREKSDQAHFISVVEKQRDEAVIQANNLKKDMDSMHQSPMMQGMLRLSDLKLLNIAQLRQLQTRLRNDLDMVDSTVLHKTTKLCMVCEERMRNVTLACNHFVVCAECANGQKECPYCQAPLPNNSNHHN